VTGFVYDSPDELTGVLQRVATSAGLVSAMGQAGRAVVEERYDLRIAGAAMLALYEELVA
jgi:glycosyltransferase involved in cell wall biosynthesis